MMSQTPSRRRPRASRPRSRQRGATLIIAMVMLLLMMIHSLASFTAADTQLRNAAALQARQEAQAAAQLAIAGVIGNSSFVTSAVTTPVDIDVDGDGQADYRVALSVSCASARLVTSIAIPAGSTDDASCLAAGASADGNIPCADTTWDIRAVATARNGALQSGVSVELHQGVAMRLDTSDAMRSCVGLPAGTVATATAPPLGKARTKTWWYLRPGI